MADIKAYKPMAHSLSTGQVLERPYTMEMGRLIVREMADSLALDMVDKGLVAQAVSLHVGYDVESLTQEGITYTGPIKTDRYGRRVPKSAHGSRQLMRCTSSARLITEAALGIYESEVQPQLLLRRFSLAVHGVAPEGSVREQPRQLELFEDSAERVRLCRQEVESLAREHKLQQTMIDIRKKFGKNAILKGMNLQEGATARKRNRQIGGHSA